MSGAASPSSDGATVGRRRIPSNHSTNASAVATRPRWAAPAISRPAGRLGTPSTTRASGTSTSAAITNCHPTAATRWDGAGNRLVSTTASENERLAPTAAATPTGSIVASPRSTTIATPSAATTPTAVSTSRGRRPTTAHAQRATSSGCRPPVDAATPPGSRWVATTRSGKNAPKLARATAVVRHQSAPRGRHPVTIVARPASSTPAGATRSAATVSARPGGSNSVTVT